MRLTALLTSALLASSTVALAQPGWYGEHHDRDRDHDRWRDRDDNVARDQWVTLATHVRLEGRNRAIRLDFNGRRLHAIELQAIRGRADITGAGVVYTDGHQEPIRLDQWIDARHAPNLRIDLGEAGERGVEAVVVEGRGDVAFRVIGG